MHPTGFAWLWPLVGHPTRLSDGTYADDSLATELGPGGRLLRLAQAGDQLGKQLPLAWTIDPDLLDSAADMSKPAGYKVISGDKTVPGAGSVSAQVWLQELQTATSSAQ